MFVARHNQILERPFLHSINNALVLQLGGAAKTAGDGARSDALEWGREGGRAEDTEELKKCAWWQKYIVCKMYVLALHGL